MKTKYIFYILVFLASILLGIALLGTAYNWETGIVCWSFVGGICISVGLLTWKAIYDNQPKTKK